LVEFPVLVANRKRALTDEGQSGRRQFIAQASLIHALPAGLGRDGDAPRSRNR
jgi:hypothetical protein